MAVIDEIKQRILQLDAGSFQSMCDRYLSRSGYPNTVSLGTQAGTQKTTRGTPDTYFFDTNGKYVFVEYTTQQQNVPGKIKSDIQKCLDVSSTQIPHNNISEIIYCHTSSNIEPKDDYEFRSMCEKVGIKFTIYGIDQLAQDLYLKHRGIAKEYLHLSIDTNQIESIDEFIKHYDASKLAAPLSTQFLFREDELKELDTLFQQNNVIVLTGPAGTGKTRLALQYAETYSQSTGAQLLCIHDNALPLYEDLYLYMEMPGHYMLVVDDANQLSGLQHVVQYATKQADGYTVKILITVRDYAVSKVKSEIHGIASYNTFALTLLSDEQIQQLVKQELGILNENYLARIAHLAEGNARIAMLAGKLASEANRLDSIDDITQLYAAYYSNALVEAGLDANKELLVTAGIIAFLRTLHIDRIDSLTSVLTQSGLSRDSFVENLFHLHRLELVDICNDKAVRFSEQCLANYILKYVFYDKKVISLKVMIRACFDSYHERTLAAINTLLSVYHVADLHDFVAGEIRTLWRELADENHPSFFDYVKAYFPLNPTETLLMMQGIVDEEETVTVPIEEIDTNVDKSLQHIRNDVLNILGGFADTQDLETALDLFFEFFRKRPDYFTEFYHTITTYFLVSRHSYKYGFYTQIKLLEKFKTYSDDWSNEYVIQLFLAIAPKFLALRFDGIENGRRNTATFYSFSLVLSTGVEEYRTIIWEYLCTLCTHYRYQAKIFTMLKDYGRSFDDSSKDVIKLDTPYIASIMELAFPATVLSNCLLAEKITQVLSCVDDTLSHSLDVYLRTPKLTLYSLLKGPRHNLDKHFSKREKDKKEAIEQYVVQCSATELIELIDICKECSVYDGDDNYEISNGLDIALQCFSAKGDCFIEVARYYLRANTPFNIYPITILRLLFSIITPSEVLTLISTEDYDQKNSWLYAYYHELPIEAIDNEQLVGLYSFLRDPSDASLTKAFNRNIDFLEKYCKVDTKALTNGARIILSKASYSRFAAHIYFSLLFNVHRNSPESVINKFSDDLELLEDIYIEAISYSYHDDYDGSFIKEIYRVSPTILDKYITKILCATKRPHFDDYNDHSLAFFDTENANDIFDTIVDALTQTATYAVYDVSDFIESIVTPREKDSKLQNKQDQWIRHFISSYSRDNDKMEYLFFGIATLPAERRVAYVKLFLDCNSSFDAFKSLPLFPLTSSWSNSAVPYFSSRIRYLEQLLPYFVGLKFILHKKLIEDRIEDLKYRVQQEEIRDILDS